MDKVHIGSLASVVDNNILWMSNMYFNGLFRINLDTQEIQCVGAFEGVNPSAYDLHRGAHVSGAEVIFTPFYDQAIRIYHSDSGNYQTIEIPGKHKPPFSRSTKIGQHIYFLSEDGCVWNYDIEKYVLKEDDLSIGYKEFLKKTEGMVLSSADSEGFTLIQYKGSVLYRINIVEHKAETFSIPVSITNFETSFYNKGLFWFFLSDSQDIVSWDKKQMEFIFYKCDRKRWGKDKFKVTPYGEMLFTDNGIFVSNFNAESPVCINQKKQSVDPIIGQLDDFQIITPNYWGAIYSNMHIVGKEICFVPYSGNLLIFYNQETKIIRTLEMAVFREQISYIDEILADDLKKNIVKEGESLYSLGEFVQNVKKYVIDQEKDNNSHGQSIWKRSI